MLDYSASGMAYNRFQNLDSIEDRIIYYLLSPKNKTEDELKEVHKIWRILYYNDLDALIDDEKHPLPKYTDVIKLIYNNNGTQNKFRIFRSPRMEDAWTEECTLLKIYIDSIIPDNHLRAVVNVGIDIVVNTKIINLAVPDDEINVFIDTIEEGGEEIPVRVQTKSRVSVMLRSILRLLNGADVAGIGRMIFSRQQNIQNQAQYGLWSNRNFEGIKLVIGASMSGVD